jgi:hypothetical protein
MLDGVLKDVSVDLQHNSDTNTIVRYTMASRDTVCQSGKKHISVR